MDSGSDDRTKQMEQIAESLAKVDQIITESIWEMAQGMDTYALGISFNQSAMDFFNSAIKITNRRSLEKKFGFSAYLSLFEISLKGDKRVPVDQFTFLILRFAPDIYNGSEQMFLDMHIPDGKVKSGNGFNIVQSQEFKNLWKILNKVEKDEIKEHITSLTTYSHAYFVRLLLESS